MATPPNDLLHRHGVRMHGHPHHGRHHHWHALHASMPQSELQQAQIELDGHGHGHHEHTHNADHEHGHSHGLIDDSITRSQAGLRAVGLSLGLLGLTAAAQTVSS
jgi:hypothetical protein